MDYAQTTAWMFSKLPMYQQKGSVAMNARLSGIQDFCTYLGNPQSKFKSIHVAGTNGKGSTSHMLASILQEAGYSVGLYTSPHLKDYRERIKVNGNCIDLDFVVEFIAAHKEYIETHQLSFFEMTVGLSFDYFSKRSLDIAVIEVGLGGRLDATNVITPILSVITNIGKDHTQFLGTELKDIAREKAGIIKPKVPVVVSEYQEEVTEVFKEVARVNNAPIFFAKSVSYSSDLTGNYQSKNINGVVEAISHLNGFNVDELILKRGLMHTVRNTGLLGRWQKLGEKPFIVADTAHNKEGLSYTLEHFKSLPHQQMHIVVGFVSDKDLDSVLPLFPKEASYYFCAPNIPRALEVSLLEKNAADFGLKGNVYPSVCDALNAAQNTANEADIIYVGGSTFVVAEVV